jgi:hypothetical protein
MKTSMNKKLVHLSSIAALVATLAPESHAFSPIIRPYQSARSAAMGNVRYTTGLYEENFYANPARATANPENLFQFPKLTLEVGGGTLSSLQKIMNSTGGGMSAVSGAVGEPLSTRIQLLALAYHNNHFFSPQWSMSFGVPFSIQIAGQVSQSSQVSPTTVIGGGPALTIARKLLPEDRLSIGMTTHFESSFSSGASFSLLDFLRGNTSDNLRGGSGASLDFDLGTTFRPHWGLGGFKYETAFAINNILGGTYNNLGGRIKGWSGDPIPSKRSFNFGVAARKDALWKFENFVMALEFTDIGNNTNGSFFRTIHFGSEARWHRIDLRAGLNQGYLSGGLGFDLKILKISLTTYGEEMGLNTGSLEDRRYAFDFGFQI